MAQGSSGATLPSNSGAAMSFASTASINSGLSGGTVGGINYTDAGSSKENGKDQFKDRFINPLKKKEITKVLNIDSRFRDNYYSTNSTDYNIKLPLSFEKVIQMELMHIELPLTFYAVTKEKGNNYFWIKIDRVGEELVDIYFQVELADGNYQVSEIKVALDNAIYNSLVEQYQLGDISLDVNIESYTNKLFFNLSERPTSVIGYEINFSCPYMEGGSLNQPTDRLNEHYRTVDGTSLQLKLGWALGYRFSKYRGSLTTYIGEAPYENPLPRYLYLALDDYNNNVNNCIYSAFNSSILNKNILAKLGYYGSSYDIYKAYKVDDGQHFRNYFGPVTIRKISIKLIDEYGRQVDLNNIDFSFGLALTCQYD
tara:strand:- start:525 stop:1631 length:1107 start_codon:yes stop_codon:yes gene_type:complete